MTHHSQFVVARDHPVGLEPRGREMFLHYSQPVFWRSPFSVFTILLRIFARLGSSNCPHHLSPFDDVSQFWQIRLRSCALITAKWLARRFPGWSSIACSATLPRRSFVLLVVISGAVLTRVLLMTGDVPIGLRLF